MLENLVAKNFLQLSQLENMGTNDSDELSTDEMSLDDEEVENNGEKPDLFDSTDDESTGLAEKEGIKNTTRNAVNNANKKSSRNKSEGDSDDSDSSDGEDVSQGYLIKCYSSIVSYQHSYV